MSGLNPTWIPVCESLPEAGVVVLAVNWLAGSRPAPKLAWFDARDAKWFAAVPGRSESVVTHWLAVPEFVEGGLSAEVKLAEAVRLLGLLVDSRACEFNRHGDCEVHHFAEPCPHELARVFVKENSECQVPNAELGTAEGAKGAEALELGRASRGDAVCEACGGACDSEFDFCHGCKRIICVDCIDELKHGKGGNHSIPERGEVSPPPAEGRP